MSAWEETTLKKVAEKISYGYTASATEQNTGVKFLRITDIASGAIDWDTVPYCEISETDLEKCRLTQGEIVIARTGATVGYAKQIRSNLHQSVFASYLVRVKLKDDVCKRFVGILTESNNYKYYINTIAGGSAQPNANAQDLCTYPFYLPPVYVQQKIAATLSAYDELIENNQRRIALLEKMAEEIYREWFVRLRFPGSGKVRFVKGVPEGWRAVQFTEICEFQKGKTPDQTFLENQDGLLPYITVEFIEGKGTGYVLKKRNSIVCENGDVLMLMDGARSGVVFRSKKGIVGSTFARVAVEPLYRDVVYEFLRATREHIVSNNTGSAIPHANKEFIHRLVMFLPENETLIEKFNALYRSLFDQTLNLVSQNELLLRSRDALLPRLISGKLSVENLDIQFPPSMAEDAHA